MTIKDQTTAEERTLEQTLGDLRRVTLLIKDRQVDQGVLVDSALALVYRRGTRADERAAVRAMLDSGEHAERSLDALMAAVEAVLQKARV